jgi:hypothetical protein
MTPPDWTAATDDQLRGWPSSCTTCGARSGQGALFIKEVGRLSIAVVFCVRCARQDPQHQALDQLLIARYRHWSGARHEKGASQWEDLRN